MLDAMPKRRVLHQGLRRMHEQGRNGWTRTRWMIKDAMDGGGHDECLREQQIIKEATDR